MDLTEPMVLVRAVRRSRALVVLSAVVAAVVCFRAGVTGWRLPDGGVARVGWCVALGMPVALAVVHQVLFRRLSVRRPGAGVGFRLGRCDGWPALLSLRPQAPHGAMVIVGVGLLAAECGGDVRDWPSNAHSLLPAGFLLLALGLWCYGGVFGPSTLALTPDGVRVGAPRPRLVGWETLAPADPVVAGRRGRTLRIPLTTTAVAERRPVEAPASLPSPLGAVNVNALVAEPPEQMQEPASEVPALEVALDTVATDRALIVHALRRYRTDVDARAALGTPTDCAELRATAPSPP